MFCPHLEGLRKQTVPFLALENKAFRRQGESVYLAQSFCCFYSPVSSHLFYSVCIQSVSFEDSVPAKGGFSA